MRTIPDDPRIDSYGQDAGVCGNCLKHLDRDCDCTEQEREEGPTLQERQENYEAELGEARFKGEDLAIDKFHADFNEAKNKMKAIDPGQLT